MPYERGQRHPGGLRRKFAEGRKNRLRDPEEGAYKAPPDAVAADEAPPGRKTDDNLALAAHSSYGTERGVLRFPRWRRGFLDIVDTVL